MLIINPLLMDAENISRLTVRVPDDRAKDFKKYLIDLNITFQDWALQKIEKELAKV